MKKTMLICLLAMIFSTKEALAQPSINHVTIYVVDMEKSAKFYKDVMQFEQISEPFHDNRHVWLRIGPHTELHIVKGATAIIPHDINIHMAFTVKSVENFAKHLDDMGVKYGNWAQTSKEPQLRPDGIKQVYLQDPDGYWIEINDDRF